MPQILVVDDEEDWRMQFKDLLELEYKYNVVVAENFQKAKEILNQQQFALILTDIKIDPKEDDKHLPFQVFCRFLKMNYPNIPVMAISCEYLDPVFMWNVLRKSGVVDFVSKNSLIVEDLLQSIEDVLPQYKTSGPSVFSNAYALLVGVGDYTHLPNLPATVKDVHSLAKVLLDPRHCGYQSNNVEIITGTKATADNIRNGLEALAQKVDEESTVLIYFSGHGGQTLQNELWQTYLCPREANPSAYLYTAIPGEVFSDLVADIKVRKLLVILDACYAGNAVELKTAKWDHSWKALPSSYYEALGQGSGRAAIASSKGDQPSFVRENGDMSVFTWHLLEGLKGAAALHNDGFVRVLDLYSYVERQVIKDKPDQEPVLHAKSVNNYPIALACGRLL